VSTKRFFDAIVAAAFLIWAARLAAQTDPVDITNLAGSENGPGLLSRDSVMNPIVSHRRPQIRPFAGVMGVYDSQLTDPTLTGTGGVPSVGAYGVAGEAGLIGYKAYKHGTVGVNYRGDYRNYVNGKFYNGTDQFIALDWRHALTKHVTVNLQESAGSYARAFSGPGIGGFLDPSLVHNPATDIFDARTHYTSTSGDLLYSSSPRLSFGFGGRGFMVRRKSVSLVGLDGYDAHGDAVYRLTRRATGGVYYRFTHYEYTRAFGAADMHTLGVQYALKLSRSWEFSAQVGASRVELQSTKEVTIDPVIAAITGQYSGSVATHKMNYVPDFNGRLTHGFSSGNVVFNYSRRVNPGNGVYLTSQYETGGMAISYLGLHHWNFGFDGGYDRYSSLTETIGPFHGYRGGLGLTRDLGRNFYATLRGDYRHYDIHYDFFRRDQIRATLGVTWSPGELPLALW
jgi:hypothetical protein